MINNFTLEKILIFFLFCFEILLKPHRCIQTIAVIEVGSSFMLVFCMNLPVTGRHVLINWGFEMLLTKPPFVSKWDSKSP